MDTRPIKEEDERSRARTSRADTQDDPVLRHGLPRSCNVYMPKALRRTLEDLKYEVRNHVSVMFVDLKHLALSEQELIAGKVADEKVGCI